MPTGVRCVGLNGDTYCQVKDKGISPQKMHMLVEEHRFFKLLAFVVSFLVFISFFLGLMLGDLTTDFGSPHWNAIMAGLYFVGYALVCIVLFFISIAIIPAILLWALGSQGGLLSAFAMTSFPTYLPAIYFYAATVGGFVIGCLMLIAFIWIRMNKKSPM
jgi:hypothetical protein